jgi:predicted RNA-binding protein YlqC (UPF0109 family)
MKEIAQAILTRMVDYPEKVEVTEDVSENLIVVEVQVEKSDAGKVIGKQGSNINALRVLLKAIAAKDFQKRLLVQLKEG